MSEAIKTGLISRADWQRGPGSVIVSRAMDQVFAQPLDVLNPHNIGAIDRSAQTYASQHRISLTWARAYALSDHSMSVPSGGAVPNHEVIESQIVENTTLATSAAAISEGVRAEEFFLINLALVVSQKASERNIPGFDSDELKNIASILRRSDFRDLVDVATFTGLGVWGPFSTEIKTKPVTGNGQQFDVMFDENNKVSFPPEFVKYLRDQVAETNREGRKKTTEGESRAVSSTSGCPARNKKPKFPNTPEGMEELMVLSEAYGVSPDELQRERNQSVIHDGMDRVADTLDAADYYLETGIPFGQKPPLKTRVRKLAATVFGL